MDKLKSIFNRWILFRTPLRDKATDTSPDVVDAFWKVLDGMEDFLPEFGAVVYVLWLIVKQLRNARLNSKTTEELTKQVLDLVQLIDELIKDVKGRIDSLKQATGLQKIDFGLDEFEGSKQITAIVGEVVNELKTLPDMIMNAYKKTFNIIFWRNGELESQLAGVKERLEDTVQGFRIKRETIVNIIVVHLELVVRAIQNDNKDLSALPFVHADHKAAGESSLLKGTRVELIDDIQGWASGSTSSGFFILTGAAGMGKSTVMREVAYRLEQKGQLGASFFFVRSGAGALGSMHNVFPTIAFQLAIFQSALRPYIANAARKYMTCGSGPRSTKEQLETLILAPLSAAQAGDAYPSEKPIVVILDALDEASGDLHSFLEVLRKLVNKKYRFRILISTRPEAPVLHVLRKAAISPSARRAYLDHIDRNVVDRDIRLFFHTNFQELRWRNELLSAHPNAVDLLTEKAEGLFIYARTVINHLDHNVRDISMRRLNAITDGGEGATGVSALDELYASVLQNAYDDDAMSVAEIHARVTAVSAGLVILHDQVTINVLAPLMGVSEEDTVRTLEDLRSIISCSGPDLRRDIIRPLHQTLREFLVDKERCKNRDFLIDRQLHHRNVAESCLRIMIEELHRDMCQLGDAFKDEVKELEKIVNERLPPHVQYACVFWFAHAMENEPSAEVRRLLGVLCKEKLLQWIEAMSLINQLRLAIQILLTMHSWTKDHAEFGDISALLYDGYRLVATFFEAINRSPRQVYSSGLSFSPDSALVKLYAKGRESNCLFSPRDELWGSCLHVLSGEFDIRPAFSRDGRLLALPLDSEVEIRDVTTLDLQNTVECVREVVSVDFHPHDNSLISDLCVDGTMEEWNISADRYSRYETHRGYYRETKPFPDKVSYNADGTRIIYCSEGFRAILVRSTEEFSHSLMEITMPAMKFKTFALDSDGRHVDALFVSEDEPAVMKRWNIVTGDEVKSLRIATDEIYCTVFSKNNTVLITGHQNKICVWTLDDDTSSLSTTINGDWRVTAIDVTRSGDVIASGGDDGVIRLFDASSGDPLAVYRGHTQPITSVVFSPQEDRLVSTSRDETVRIWDTRKEAWSLSSSGSMRHVVFSPNGRIIAASARNDIIISDGRDGSVLCTFTGHTDSVRSLAFSPDNTLLASFSRTDGVFLWSIGTKGSLPRLLSNSNTIDTDSSWIVFSAYGTQLAIVNETFMDESVTFSFQVRIWDVPNSNGVDSAEPGNELFHSNSHDGRSPHLLRLSSNESLTFVRHLEPDENDKVIVWDRITDAMEEHDYDQDSHSSLKPVFVEDRGWVVSARTGRQLFWLPESRRPSCRDSVATRGNLIAIGSSTGVLSLLDMSPLGGL